MNTFQRMLGGLGRAASQYGRYMVEDDFSKKRQDRAHKFQMDIMGEAQRNRYALEEKMQGNRLGLAERRDELENVFQGGEEAIPFWQTMMETNAPLGEMGLSLDWMEDILRQEQLNQQPAIDDPQARGYLSMMMGIPDEVIPRTADQKPIDVSRVPPVREVDMVRLLEHAPNAAMRIAELRARRVQGPKAPTASDIYREKALRSKEVDRATGGWKVKINSAGERERVWDEGNVLTPQEFDWVQTAGLMQEFKVLLDDALTKNPRLSLKGQSEIAQKLVASLKAAMPGMNNPAGSVWGSGNPPPMFGAPVNESLPAEGPVEDFTPEDLSSFTPEEAQAFLRYLDELK